NWTPVATAASRLTKISSWKAATIAFIKFASKEAIPRAIRFVFRERALALAGHLWARSFLRDQSRHGMVICCGARLAGAEGRGGACRAGADRAGPRAIDWSFDGRG